MALGGGANLGKVSKSINNKTDYRTGLTANEESVFDKVYESKITEAENSGNNLTGKQKAVIYDNALQQVKSGEVDIQTIEVALGGEDYGTYKNVLNNYEILQQKLNELQSIDNKAKTPEQTVKEQEIKQRLEQTKIQADKLKNILQNKVAEKIDVDNIHLKDRESYLWDSYVGKLPNFANDNLNSAKMSQEIDEDAFVEGLWDDGKDTVNSDSAEYVENSGLKLFDNNKGSMYNKNNLATIGNSGEKAKPYSTNSIPQYINQYLYKLKNYGDILNVKEPLSFSDISLMSRQSGTEYASITIGDEHYIIKGNTKSTPISNEMFEKIRKNRGILNCHSHPYIDDFRVSKEDINVAKQMYWQKKFYIISPDGKFATYDSNGIIDIDIIKKELNDSDLQFYEELFKED